MSSPMLVQLVGAEPGTRFGASAMSGYVVIYGAGRGRGWGAFCRLVSIEETLAA
jgi:hypothetical protein